MSLKNRIKRLEQRRPMEKPSLFIGRAGVPPAGWSGNGVEVWRRPNETEEALKERAIREAGAALFIQLEMKGA